MNPNKTLTSEKYKQQALNSKESISFIDDKLEKLSEILDS